MRIVINQIKIYLYRLHQTEGILTLKFYPPTESIEQKQQLYEDMKQHLELAMKEWRGEAQWQSDGERESRNRERNQLLGLLGAVQHKTTISKIMVFGSGSLVQLNPFAQQTVHGENQHEPNNEQIQHRKSYFQLAWAIDMQNNISPSKNLAKWQYIPVLSRKD